MNIIVVVTPGLRRSELELGDPPGGFVTDRAGGGRGRLGVGRAPRGMAERSGVPLPGSPALKRVASLEIPGAGSGGPAGAGLGALPLRQQPAYSGGNSFGALACVGVRLTPLSQALGQDEVGHAAEADLAALRERSPGPQRAALVAASLRRLGRLGVECETSCPSSSGSQGKDPLPQLGPRTRLELRIDGESDPSARGWHGFADSSVGSQRPLPLVQGASPRGGGGLGSDADLAHAWSGLLHHNAPAAVLALALVNGSKPPTGSPSPHSGATRAHSFQAVRGSWDEPRTPTMLQSVPARAHLPSELEGELSMVRSLAAEEVARRLSVRHPEAMLHGVLVVHDDGRHQIGEGAPAAIYLNGGLLESLDGRNIAEIGSLGGVLQALAAALVQAVRSWLVHANPGSANLKTPFDLLQGLRASSEEERARKQAITDGRLRKKMGDFSLMVGDAGDAFLHYCAAIDIARAHSDDLWLAAALEGITAAEAYAAHAAQDKISGVSTPKVEDMMQSWEDAVEACTAASKIYEKIGLVCFHISALIRLAKHGVSLLEKLRTTGADLKGVTRLDNDVKTILRMSLQACSRLTLPTMAVDHGLILADISDIWLCLGKKRRFAFYAKQAAEALPASQEWAEVAMQLMISAAEVYKAIAIPRDSRRFFNYAVPVVDTSEPWPSLQKAIQDSLLLAAVKVGDSELVSTAAFHCLTLKTLMHPPSKSDIDTKEWESLFRMLKSGSYEEEHDGATTAISMDQQPTWPVATAFELLLPPEDARVIRHEKPTGPRSVFIYDANKQKLSASDVTPIFPRAENITVAVALENPFYVSLKLTLELKTSGDHQSSGPGWISQRTTVEMPGRIPGAPAQVKDVNLCGFANRGQGSLRFLGCLVTCHGVQFFQPWKGLSRRDIYICPPMALLTAAFEKELYELYEGETLMTHLKIYNQSNVEPRLVGVKVGHGVAKAASDLQLSVEDLMSKEPPVTGIGRAEFKIVAPKMEQRGRSVFDSYCQSHIRCQVQYSAPLHTAYTRTMEIPFGLTTLPCLRMESCAVEKNVISMRVTNHLQEAVLLKIHWALDGPLSSRKECLDSLDKIGKGCTNTFRVALPIELQKMFAKALENTWPSEVDSRLSSLKRLLAETLERSMVVSWSVSDFVEPMGSSRGARSQKKVLFSEVFFSNVLMTCFPLRLALTCESAATMPRLAGCEVFNVKLRADSLFVGACVEARLDITCEGARAGGITGMTVAIPPGEAVTHLFRVCTIPAVCHAVQVRCDVCQGITETIRLPLPARSGFSQRIPREVSI